MINSADIHGADSIMIDIEDSVPITEKDTARLLTAEALKSRKFRAETVVRINHPTQTPYGYDDLDVIVPAKPDMIRLPKTEDVSEVEIVAKKIEEVEQKLQNANHTNTALKIQLERQKQIILCTNRQIEMELDEQAQAETDFLNSDVYIRFKEEINVKKSDADWLNRRLQSS